MAALLKDKLQMLAVLTHFAGFFDSSATDNEFWYRISHSEWSQLVQFERSLERQIGNGRLFVRIRHWQKVLRCQYISRIVIQCRCKFFQLVLMQTHTGSSRVAAEMIH
ncbi:hypothetical protein D3C75_787880 [compost metagenome]